MFTAKNTIYNREKNRVYIDLTSINFTGRWMNIIEETIKHLYGNDATCDSIPSVRFKYMLNSQDRLGLEISFRNPDSSNYSRYDQRKLEKMLEMSPRRIWFTAKGRYINGKKIKEIVADIQEKTADYIKKEREKVVRRDILDSLTVSLKNDMKLQEHDSLYVSGTPDHLSISLIMAFTDVTSVKEMYNLGRHILSL